MRSTPPSSFSGKQAGNLRRRIRLRFNWGILLSSASIMREYSSFLPGWTRPWEQMACYHGASTKSGPFVHKSAVVSSHGLRLVWNCGEILSAFGLHSMLSSAIIAIPPGCSTDLERSTPEVASRCLVLALKKNLRLPLPLDDRHCQDRQGPNHHRAKLKRDLI